MLSTAACWECKCQPLAGQVSLSYIRGCMDKMGHHSCTLNILALIGPRDACVHWLHHWRGNLSTARCFRRLTLQKCLILVQTKLLPVGSRLLQQICRQLFQMFRRPLEERGTAWSWTTSSQSNALQSGASQRLFEPAHSSVASPETQEGMLREDTVTTELAGFPSLLPAL